MILLKNNKDWKSFRILNEGKVNCGGATVKHNPDVPPSFPCYTERHIFPTVGGFQINYFFFEIKHALELIKLKK